jgi:hypothetical protein
MFLTIYFRSFTRPAKSPTLRVCKGESRRDERKISRWCKPPGVEYKTYQAPIGALENQPHMSSTHLSLHYHIVFGTKNHEPMICSGRRVACEIIVLQPTRLPLQSGE